MNDKLAELLGYLKENFKSRNGNQSYGLYTNPTSKIIMDPSIEALGIQPVRNTDIYLNPALHRDQQGWLSTLFHEYAHVEQPRLASLFNFTDPTYRALNKVDFSGYYNEKSAPGAEEVLASLREEEAMSKAGTTVHDTDMGKDVLSQLKRQHPDKSEQALRLMLDKAMFPKRNFMYPSTDTTKPPSLFDLFR